MATVSPSTSIDVLSVLERKLVVDALSLKVASLSRAAKSSTNEAVSAAYVLERQSVEALISKFR